MSGTFPGLAEIGAWDYVRLLNVTLGAVTMLIMATRYRSWLRLPTAERFHWLATGGLTAAITYGNVELFLTNATGGPRLALQLAALIYLLVALRHARGTTPVVLSPTAPRSTPMTEPAHDPVSDPTFDDGGATAPDPKPPVSPKVTAASLGSLAAGVALALLLAVTSPEGSAVTGGLPPVLQFLLLAAVPPVVTFLAGFQTPNSVKYLAPALRAARHQGR